MNNDVISFVPALVPAVSSFNFNAATGGGGVVLLCPFLKISQGLHCKIFFSQIETKIVHYKIFFNSTRFNIFISHDILHLSDQLGQMTNLLI